LSWDPEHLRASPAWFNPWPVKYLLPAIKWFPLYWPNGEWEVRSFPPSWPMEAPQIPDGLAIPWWKAPKDTWPYQTPFEPKIFGAWPASQISTPGDVRNHPPFGYIKLKMPGQIVTSGNAIPFTNMKMYMRHLSSTQMKVMTIVTPFGPKFYLKSEDWDKYEKEYREHRAARKAKREARYRELLAAEIADVAKGKVKPMTDLFA
jgi:hypothetical protein